MSADDLTAWCEHCGTDVTVEWIDAERVPPRHVQPDPRTMVEARHTRIDNGLLSNHHFDVPQDRAADIVATDTRAHEPARRPEDAWFSISAEFPSDDYYRGTR